MIVELFTLLCIIVVVLVLLLILKPIHVHVMFNNTNLEYDLYLRITVLSFIRILIRQNSGIILSLSLKIFNKEFSLFDKKLNEDLSQDEESDENVETTDNQDDSDENEDNGINKIREIISLLSDLKEDIQKIFSNLIRLIQFEESVLNILLGLQDNNLTIKTSNFLWALFAPLYPLNVKLNLAPVMNDFQIKSDITIKFNIYLINAIKIVFVVLRNKKMRTAIIKFIS